jgi:5'(3')-deoxyribonucleotidase
MKKFTFGNIREFDKAEVLDTRTVEFIISSAAKDRYDSIVNMEGWQLDNFNKNPIVGYQHNVYGGNMCTPDDPDDVIGTGRAFLEGAGAERRLIGSVKFESGDINPKAEKIFKKVLAGTLRATSVGFLEIGDGEWVRKTDDKGNVIDKTYFFKGQELLEFSIVNIPANPEAVGRSLEVQQDWAMQFIQRFMPETMSMADIKQMKVQDVLDLVNGKIKEQGKDKSLFSKRLQLINSKLKYT